MDSTPDPRPGVGVTSGEVAALAAIGYGIVFIAAVLFLRSRRGPLTIQYDGALAVAVVLITVLLGAIFLLPAATLPIVIVVIMISSGLWLGTQVRGARGYETLLRFVGWLLVAIGGISAVGVLSRFLSSG